METYNAKLISADFEESTMEFEIQHEFTVKAGDYVILHKADYDKLVSGANSENANCAIFDVKHSADAAFCCGIEQEKIPYSNMIRTILKIESLQIVNEAFIDDLMKLLQKHCA